MSNYGLIITLPGFSAANPALTPDQCAVHSSYDSMKVSPNTNTPTVNGTYFSLTSHSTTNYNYGWVRVSITADPAVTTANVFTINHGLGYIPGCLGMVKGLLDATTYFLMPTQRQAVGDIAFSYYADATKLSVDVLGDGSVSGFVGTDLTFKYYVFVQDGV